MLRSLPIFLVMALPIFNAHSQTTKIAKPPAPEISARESAETEIQTPPASVTANQKTTATTGALSAEQTATMLQLEDPFQAPRLRSFQWSFGVFLSQHKPQGTLEVSGIGSQNLGSTGSSIMPSISLGTLYGISENGGGVFQVGLEAEAGFASQKSNITTVNGTVLEGRLNSLLMEGRTLLRWGQNWSSPVHARLGVGWARYSATQTSDNSLARWSKTMNLTSFLIGADYKLSRRWLARANYRSFMKRDNTEGLKTPEPHFELGAQVIW